MSCVNSIAREYKLKTARRLEPSGRPVCYGFVSVFYLAVSQSRRFSRRNKTLCQKTPTTDSVRHPSVVAAARGHSPAPKALLQSFCHHFYRATLYQRGICYGLLSVRPFLTSPCYITEITPHHRPGILVLCCQRSPQNSTGNTPCEVAKCGVGWGKINDFGQITCYIQRTVQDRRTVSIKVEQKVACALSNSDIADDLG